MHADKNKTAFLEAALLVLLGFLWGIPYALNKVSLATIPPMTGVAARVLYQSAVIVTRLGFPNQLQRDSRWQTEGGLPWGLPLRYGQTIQVRSFAGWQAG